MAVEPELWLLNLHFFNICRHHPTLKFKPHATDDERYVSGIDSVPLTLSLCPVGFVSCRPCVLLASCPVGFLSVDFVSSRLRVCRPRVRWLRVCLPRVRVPGRPVGLYRGLCSSWRYSTQGQAGCHSSLPWSGPRLARVRRALVTRPSWQQAHMTGADPGALEQGCTIKCPSLARFSKKLFITTLLNT